MSIEENKAVVRHYLEALDRHSFEVSENIPGSIRRRRDNR
jgi:hypothetical protein